MSTPGRKESRIDLAIVWGSKGSEIAKKTVKQLKEIAEAGKEVRKSKGLPEGKVALNSLLSKAARNSLEKAANAPTPPPSGKPSATTAVAPIPSPKNEPEAATAKKYSTRSKNAKVNLVSDLISKEAILTTEEQRKKLQDMAISVTLVSKLLKDMGLEQSKVNTLMNQGKAGVESDIISMGKQIAGIRQLLIGEKELSKRHKEQSKADTQKIPIFREANKRKPSYKLFNGMTRDEKDEYYSKGIKPVKRKGTSTPERVPEDERANQTERESDSQRVAKHEADLMTKDENNVESIRAKESKVHKEYFDAQGAKVTQTQKKYDKLTGSLKSTGIRLGWLGFRMVTIGKLMLRWMTTPINDLVKSMVNWQQSMTDLATTIGYMSAMGLGSSSMLNTLYTTLGKLPEAGMMFAAALGAIEGVLLTIGVDLAPLVAPAIMSIAEAFLKLWQKVSPTVIPMLQKLIDTLLPRLLTIIDEVGPAFIINFVTALGDVAGAFVTVLEVMTPFIPTLGTILGWVVGLSPLLVILGTALFMLSLPLQLIGTLLSGVSSFLTLFGGGIGAASGATGIFGTAIAALTPLLLPLGAVLLVVISVVATLYAWWNELSDTYNSTLGPAIAGLSETLGKLFGAISVAVDWMEVLRFVTAPLASSFAVLMWVAGKLVDMLTLLIDPINHVIDIFKGWFGSSSKGLTDMANGANKATDAITGTGIAVSKIPTYAPTQIDFTGTTSQRTQPQVEAEIAKLDSQNTVFKDALAINKITQAQYNTAMAFQSQKLQGLQVELQSLSSKAQLQNAYSINNNSLLTQSKDQLANLNLNTTSTNSNLVTLTQTMAQRLQELSVFNARILQALCDGTKSIVTQLIASVGILNAASLKLTSINSEQAKQTAKLDRPNETTMYTTINFTGPISGNVDMNKIVDTVNKTIAEQLRMRKAY